MRNCCMLKRLHISNFALIQEMDVHFPGGLTVITGETGAGKSIFLDAMGLALGKRADTSALRDKTKKCIVEAEFDIKQLELNDFFEENDLDKEDSVVLRREINVEGKSRSFLNDTPVNVSALKQLSERLIDIHSQHQTLLLNQVNFQLELLDAYAGNAQVLKTYKDLFFHLNKQGQQLKDLQEQEGQAKKELDYFQFLFDELEGEKIHVGVIGLLQEESAKLENAETIKSALANAASVINSGDQNVLGALSASKQNLQSIAKYNKKFQDYFDRINSVYIELKDLASDIENEESQVLLDSNKLDEVNSRLDRLTRLFKKHQVENEEQLLLVKKEIETKLHNFSSLESRIAKLVKEINETTKAAEKLAKELSDKRKSVTSIIEEKIESVLKGLSMENARFKIEVNATKELGSTGIDQVKFLFSANKGIALSDLQKVASGGELSRLMLSLKALLAEKKQLPTIIFDEVDAGVSGDVADKIGSILFKIGQRMQVVAITHLPQMASKGKHHLFVYKNDKEEKTASYIKQLNEEERVLEIAKMLSTGNPSSSALVNAKELLNAN